MKSLCIFILVIIFPFVVVGQQATDSLAKQVSERKSHIAQLKWELDSIIAKSDMRASETLYGEVGGAGGWLSVNYEQRFGKNWNKNWSWRVGLGLNTWAYYSTTFSSDSLTGQQSSFSGIATAPLMINFFTDGDGSPYHFEVGAGIIPWFGTEYTYGLEKQRNPFVPSNFIYERTSIIQSRSTFRFLAPVSIGYRYQPVDGGFFFKVSAMALIGGSLGNFPVFPWIGFSFGETYSIK